MRTVGAAVVYLLVMIAIIIAVDVLFFRHRFWPRLGVNVAIVIIFALVYYRIVRRPL